MSSILPETALILIAILPSQRDFDIARLFGWYRIPLKSAPKVISVDYLASTNQGLWRGGALANCLCRQHSWPRAYPAA